MIFNDNENLPTTKSLHQKHTRKPLKEDDEEDNQPHQKTWDSIRASIKGKIATMQLVFGEFKNELHLRTSTTSFHGQ